MADIKLNFINASNDANNSNVVIFQRNEKAAIAELGVAWKVIQNCGMGDNHPFVYPMDMTINANDSDGNFTPSNTAVNGQRWSMTMNSSGHNLGLKDNNGPVTEIQLLNELSTGAINANILKDGRLLATKTNVVPQSLADFQFKPVIYICVSSEVVEGDLMNSAVLSIVATPIPLLGIASADIIMTGGGTGTTATAYQFTISNVKTA